MAETWPFFGRFHLIFLHFPIGFFGVIALLELYSLFRGSPQLRQGIGLVHAGMVVTALIAASLGLILATEGGYDTTALDFHKWAGLSVVGGSLLAALLHRQARARSATWRSRLGYVLSLFLLGGLISAAGHYGGNLTHGSAYLFEHAPPALREMMPGFLFPESMVTSPETSTTDGDRFTEEVLPIFRERCVSCHGESKQKGDLRLDSYSAVFVPGESEEPVVKPGNPHESLLVQLILLPPDDSDVMPPRGKGVLTADEILTIVRWVQEETGPAADPEEAADPQEAEEPGEAVSPEESVDPEESEEPERAEKSATTDETRKPEKVSPAELSEAEAFFVREVQPVLESQCIWCHGPDRRKSRLRLHAHSDVLVGGKEFGPAVVPGEPDESPLLRLISIDPQNDEDELLMPPIEDGGPLGAEEIEKIRKWIADGAHWPEGLELKDRS